MITAKWRRFATIAAAVTVIVVGFSSPAVASTGYKYYKNVGSGKCLVGFTPPDIQGVIADNDGTNCKGGNGTGNPWKYNNAIHNGIWSFEAANLNNTGTGYCLAAYSGMPVLRNCNAANDTSQQWAVTSNGDGTSKFKSVSDGLCLGVYKTAGTLALATCITSSYQNWDAI